MTYYPNVQRDAICRAGKLAGFTVRKVLDDSSAALISHGLENTQNKVVLLYNLGGSTFNITVGEIKNGTINIIAIGGDHLLGGEDWNNIIESIS